MSDDLDDYSVLAATNGNDIDPVDYSDDFYELDDNPVRLESSNLSTLESLNSSLNFRNQVLPPVPQYILAPGNVDAILNQSLDEDCKTFLDSVLPKYY